MNDVFEPTLAKKFKKYSVITLLFLLVCRLIAMYVMPLDYAPTRLWRAFLGKASVILLVICFIHEVFWRE